MVVRTGEYTIELRSLCVWLCVAALVAGCESRRLELLQPEIDMSPVGCNYKWFQTGEVGQKTQLRLQTFLMAKRGLVANPMVDEVVANIVEASTTTAVECAAIG